MKNKSKIIIGLLTATTLLSVAGFAFGQTQTPPPTGGTTTTQLPPLTKADLDPVLAAEQKIFNDYTGSTLPSQATIDADILAGERACVVLGDKSLALTDPSVSTGKMAIYYNVSTYWTKENTCYFGYKDDTAKKTDVLFTKNLRSYSVAATQFPPILGLRANLLASKPLTQQNVQSASWSATGAAAQALSDAVDLGSNLVNGILTTIFNILATLVLLLTTLANIALNYAINQTTWAVTPSYVNTGWQIIRDLMNMFFILALIAMSIGTILRIENYNARKWIVKLVLMALLINFSKTIAETLISASNYVMRIFAAGFNVDNFWANTQSYFDHLIFQGSNSNSWTSFLYQGGGTASSALVAGITKLIASLLILVSYGAIAVLLFIRVIGLWFLIIISPAAYALNTLPSTQQYARQWWQWFIKYLIWAPVAVLFLYIGNIFISSLKDGTTSVGESLAPLYIAVFFLAALYVTRQAGMIGAGAVLKAADSTWKGGSTMLSKYALRGSLVRQAGAGLEKITGGRVTGLKKIGEKWQSGAQWVEGAPDTVKGVLQKSEAKYQRGVKEKQQLVYRKLGFIGTGKDDLENLEKADYQKVMEAEMRKPADSVNLEKLRKMIADGPEQALSGILQYMATDARLATGGSHANVGDIINQALHRRMGGSGVAGRYTYTVTGDHVEVSGIPVANAAPGTTTTRSFFTSELDKALEAEIITDDLKKDEARLQQRVSLEQAKAFDPDIEKRITEAELAHRIPTMGEATNIKLKLDAANQKIGNRIDLPIAASVLPSGTGVRVSYKVADDPRLQYQADLFLKNNNDEASKQEISNLAAVLKENGVQEQEISKLVSAYTNSGGIRIQRGTFEPLKRVGIDEGQIKQERLEYMRAAKQPMQHEASHALYQFVNRQNAADYSKLVEAVKNDPKFQDIRKTTLATPTYAAVAKGMDEKQVDAMVAEEILARSKGRTNNLIGTETQNKVNAILDNYRKDFLNNIKEVGRAARIESREPALRQQVMARIQTAQAPAASTSKPAPVAAVNNEPSVASAVKGIEQAAEGLQAAADNLSKTSGNVSNLTTGVNSTLERLKQNAVQQKEQTTEVNKGLKEAASQIVNSAKSSAETLKDVVASTAGPEVKPSVPQAPVGGSSAANDLKRVAEMLKKNSEKQNPPKPTPPPPAPPRNIQNPPTPPKP